MNHRKHLIGALEKMDEAIDFILYRPAVVRAFRWLPRWWLCDLAKVSMRLDERWQTGWWDAAGVWIGSPCEACHRRAAIHVVGGPHPDGQRVGDYLDGRPIRLCGWCKLDLRPLLNEDEVQVALEMAAARSVAWRWH